MIRFKYHFEPKKGWMNDPNGLCFYKGKYHAFFQHYPYEKRAIHMHWGHAVSDDLISFKELDIALTPDESYENSGGCFSGSAIEKDGVLYLFYTSVSHELKQTQSVAYSTDGVNFTKHPNNPIIRSSPLGDNSDFRDPKVIEYNGSYYLVCGAAVDNKGKILLFRSDNLIDWSFVDVIYENTDYVSVPECPDLFFLDGKWVLMFSAIGVANKTTVFLVGEFDGKSFKIDKKCFCEYGDHFYAPQTFRDELGRRIMIGWMYSWAKLPDENDDSAGALSIPRELHIVDSSVIAFPVDEAKHLLRSESEYVKVENGVITVSYNGNIVAVYDTNDIDEIDEIKKIDILTDEKSVEIFVNNGKMNFSRWLW